MKTTSRLFFLAVGWLPFSLPRLSAPPHADHRFVLIPSPASASPEGSSSSRMADHFALMTGRLLTESTLQSAIHDASADAVASTAAGYDQTDPSVVLPDDVQLGMGKGKAKSGVMVECRICQEEGDEAYMETPCSCKGSLKYAHHRCVQRWCNEKGDTICEICLQQLKPNYTAPLFRHGRNLVILRAAGEIRENLSASYGHTSDQADGASSVDSQSPNLKGVIYCRVVAIALMVLLVLRDAILLILRNHEVCSVELITLLMFRTVGIVIPIYIILISIAALLHWCNQRQIVTIQVVHETPVSGPRGAWGLQHIINIW